MTPHSYLHLENDTLRVDVEREKKLQVPLHRVERQRLGQVALVAPAPRRERGELARVHRGGFESVSPNGQSGLKTLDSGLRRNDE